MTSHRFADRYFDRFVEYPYVAQEDILQMGCFFQYVSSSLLDGFVNYVTPVKAYVRGRYLEWDSEEEWKRRRCELSIQDPPGSYKWKKVQPKTKAEAFDILTTKGAVMHPDLSDFGDDLLLLATSRGRVYWFFWFDMDSSDCCIGRFRTKDPQEEVVASFSQFALSSDFDNPHGSREVPLHYFKNGWLSW